MGYLIFSDYKKQIQVDNLQQVIGNDLRVLDECAATAQEEAESYLVQKYDVGKEFTNTILYAPGVYQAAERVYLNGPAFDATLTYALNFIVLFAGNVYRCTTAVTVPAAFNPAQWLLLGAQYDILYVTYPKPLFNSEKIYKPGDQIFYNGKTYTCIIGTVGIDHSGLVQINQSAAPDYYNIFPDNLNQGKQYWGIGVAYSVGTFPVGWTLGDNRSSQMKTYVIDVALYHMHSRIAPRNIPDLRVKRYDDAVSWFKKAMTGTITPKLAVIQPKTGSRIRFGSDFKQQNGY